MRIVGRNNEKEGLMQCLLSKRPEFVVVYGRRRVGKTYLIREYFNKSFSFYATGLTSEKTKGQLRGFTASLNEYGHAEKSIPADWFEAFSRLKELLSVFNSLGSAALKKVAIDQMKLLVGLK